MEQSNGAPSDVAVSMTELQASLKEEQELNKDLLTSILGNANAEDLALFGDQQGAGSARNPMNLSEIQRDTLINSLLKENQQLSMLIKHMTVDRNNAQSKVTNSNTNKLGSQKRLRDNIRHCYVQVTKTYESMVDKIIDFEAILIEQQSEETARFKTMMKDELEDHLREIRKILIMKESLIQQAEIEKVQSTEPIPSYVDPSALLVHRDIVTPSVGLLRVHEDTEIIKKEISKRVDDIQELQKKRKAIVLSTKAIRFQVAQLENALSSNSYKAKQCLHIQETVLSDDEDYNACHLRSKVSNFNRIIQIQKIKAEKLNLQNKGLFISDVSPNNAMGTLKASKMSQLEIEIEKYKNLSTEWHKSNEMKLKALEKIDRYNSSLLKSNAQLVEGSIRIQTKAALTNRRLRTYKRSYQTLVNLKKNRYQNLQATLKEHNSISSQSNNNSTIFTGSFVNNNYNESSFSPGILNSNSSRGNGLNVNNGISLTNSQYNSSGLFNNLNANKLLSVEEEELDENVVQRKTLTAYQSAGSKANTDLCSDPKDKQSKKTDNHDSSHNPWMNLKQTIEYLFKVKQQLDRCCKQAHFATSIPTSDPRYVSASSIPSQIFQTRRSLSACCDGSSRLSQGIDWQKEKLVKQRNNFLYESLDISDVLSNEDKHKNKQNQEDYEKEEEGGQLLQLPEETDETEEQEQLQLQQQQQQQYQYKYQSAVMPQVNQLHQEINHNHSNFSQKGNGISNINGGVYPKLGSKKQSYEINNRNDTDSDNEESRTNNNNNQGLFNLPPPTHNNSFFRELDISVIQVQNKNKRH